MGNNEIPKDIDEKQVAAILSCLPRDKESTCYKYIKRLPPGHILTFDKSGLKVSPYKTLENIPQIYLQNDAEYVERFLELYRKAVKTRIASSSKTGISLSGGLDSGTVAVLAAEELAVQGGNLYSYSQIPIYDTKVFLPASRFGNESGYIKSLCDRYQNIIPKFLDSKHISPVDGIIRSLDLCCQPMHAAGNMFWIHDIRETAGKDGIDTLLNGQFGNMAVSFAGLKDHSKGLIDFINNSGYYKLYNEKLSGKALAKLIIPELILDIIRKFKQNVQPTRSENWHNFSSINPVFAEKLGIADVQPFSQKTKKGQNPQHIMYENCFRGVDADIMPVMTEKYGVNYLDPTFDKELVEFCFGIPDEQHQRYGMARFLIRRAFNEKMPKEIIWNTDRGGQAADISFRVKDEYKRVKHILEVLKKSPSGCEILDIQKMEGVLDRTLTEQSIQIKIDTSSILLRGVMVGLFLLRNEGDKNEY
ncbi:MAG: asparagine synthase-related protein [Victivallaceae bacterium]